MREKIMKTPIRSVLIFLASILLAGSLSAQVDEICAEFGAFPSLDSPFAHVPYVYGRIALKGFDSSAKLPRVAVLLGDGQQSVDRLIIDKSGNYCFKRKSSGGTLVVEVEGIEAARRSLPAFGAAQQREDFEIHATVLQKFATPGVVLAKLSNPINPKTIELYNKTADAERTKDLGKAVGYLKEIVALDAADFIAWAKLGSVYFEQKSLSDADAAFRKSLELRVDYIPAWIFAGQLRVAQKQYEAAIQIFKHAALLVPTSARAFQLLGETYLLSRQGTLGAQALNEAIRLDPVSMAECHLQLAHLYELAGAKQLAMREYKLFLTKVPDHPDKKKFEKYIKDNPEN